MIKSIFGKPKREPFWETVKVDDLSFEVQLRRPSKAQLVFDLETASGYAWERIVACVVGWRGVTDEEGNVVQFSTENLGTLCEYQPRWMMEIGSRCNLLYAGITEDERKNSSALPGDSSPAAPTETASTEKTSEQSQSGTGSGS